MFGLLFDEVDKDKNGSVTIQELKLRMQPAVSRHDIKHFVQVIIQYYHQTSLRSSHFLSFSRRRDRTREGASGHLGWAKRGESGRGWATRGRGWGEKERLKRSRAMHRYVKMERQLKFQSDWSKWTNTRGDPEYSRRTEPKLTFSFDYRPKFREFLCIMESTPIKKTFNWYSPNGER